MVLKIENNEMVVYSNIAERPISDEIWLNIFSYLQSLQEVISLGLTNRQLQQIHSDGRLWKPFLMEHFPRSFAQNRLNIGESELYKRCATIENNILNRKFKLETREFKFCRSDGACQVYGNYIASTCYMQVVEIFDLKTQAWVRDIQCEGDISSLHVHGNYLYAGSYGTVEMWDLENFERVHKFILDDCNYIKSLCVDGDYLFVGQNNDLCFFNLNTKIQLFTLNLGDSYLTSIESIGIQDNMICVFFSDGELIILGDYKAFMKSREKNKDFSLPYSSISSDIRLCSFATFENWICIDLSECASAVFCELAGDPLADSLEPISSYDITVAQSLNSFQMQDGCLYMKEGNKIHIMDFNGPLESSPEGPCDLTNNV